MKNNSEIFIVYDGDYYNYYRSVILKKLLSEFIREYILRKPYEFSLGPYTIATKRKND